MAPIVWLNKWTFRVRHPVTGRATDVTIPGADKLEKSRLAYLVAWQTEETLGELAAPEQAKPKPSRAQQHDLGRELVAREDTTRLVEATGHGRYR